MDERSGDFDVSLFRSGADKLLKGFVVGRTAVGIAGAVLFDGSDEDGPGSQHLRPADCSGEEVSVAKRHVGDGYGLPDRLMLRSLGDSDRGIGERGTADAAEDIDLQVQEVSKLECFRDSLGAP